jgi:HEAT repeat protein/energy-coupling factor transporter ATP-binding protein EcfA2/DNA-binding Xre family transcriptional regulator
MRETRKRGFVIKPEGLALIEKTMKEKGYNSREKLAEAADYLSIDTVNRLFRGERTQRKTIEAIAEALDLKPTDLVEQNEWFPASPTAAQEKTAADEINIDWREVCHKMLKEQQDKQRLRRQATEMGFEVNVHVPLGLVERKHQQRRDGNVELSQLYQLDQEVIAKTYQHDEFLTQVIGQRQARKNNHIAIVGEPGAGKTTLLGAIASFIQSNTEDLPICITLASLQGRTLEDYLLKTWLSEAMGLVNPEVVVTPEIENELIKQFRKGEVWLLLDGVDEMGTDSPVQALTTIQKQLTDWLGQARVVLTCRLNVWDANVNNILTGFDTYRSQEFTHGQINQFIQEWFACAEKLQQAEHLQAKLKEPGRERIRDLVKQPLRLALLCQTFYLDKQGDLPETKAALYEKLICYFYEWKQSLYPEALINRDELHQALGKLALAGINSLVRFRLNQSLAYQEMGERLFKLACALGWLNLVERDAQTDEPVYAFFHPTFQEYFAAIAIDNWQCFLNHVPDNPEQGIYHIFEPQWKEVILLWLGRDDVLKEQKNEFIKALMKFEDEYQDEFYGCRAYFLAAAGISEFKDCYWGDEIVERIIEWKFGYFDIQKQEQITFLKSIQTGAETTLTETDRSRVIAALLRLIELTEDDTIRIDVAAKLLKLNPCNEIAINVLVQVIHSNKNKNNSMIALIPLWKSGIHNDKTIDELLQIIQWTDDNEIRIFALSTLCLIRICNLKVITTLVELIQSEENKANREMVIAALWYIDPGNLEAITALVQLVQSTEDENIRRQGLYNNLWHIEPGNPKAIAALVQLIQSTEDENICRQAAESLGTIDPGNPIAITTLVQLIQFTEDKETRELAIFSLLNLDPNNSGAIADLVQLIQVTDDNNIRRQAAESLGKTDPNNTEVIATLVQLIRASDDDSIRRQAAESLGKVDPDNPIAIATLLQLIQSTEDDIRRQTFDSLEKIGVGNETVIIALVQLIESIKYKDISWQVFYSLEKIGVGNETAIAALAQLIQSTDDKYICSKAVNSLGKIGTGNPDAIAVLEQLIQSAKKGLILIGAASSLKKILPEDRVAEIVTVLKNYLNYLSGESSKDERRQLDYCYELLLECAQTLPYPTFYQAWHIEPFPIQALENQFIDIASQLQPTDKTYPIAINAQALEGETDTSAIAQALSNRIYRFVFPDDSEIPPEVSNAYQLERSLLKLKKQLQKHNLALILDKCEPNQALITFCRKLTDVLHIAWITNQPLEPPLKGFPPEQANLLSALQSWIKEIG